MTLQPVHLGLIVTCVSTAAPSPTVVHCVRLVVRSGLPPPPAYCFWRHCVVGGCLVDTLNDLRGQKGVRVAAQHNITPRGSHTHVGLMGKGCLSVPLLAHVRDYTC